MIFVFGSNLAGRHGKGAALFARQNHGAIYGQGFGHQGNSFAIPTKDGRSRTLPLSHPAQTLPLETIQEYVDAFLVYAKDHPELTFEVAEIGCGLAGYTPQQIAPLFKNHTANVHLPERFKHILGE
jgi:hypothetical protein